MRAPFIAAILAVAAIAPVPSAAAEVRNFSPQLFADAQKANRPILVDVYADWCPVCRAQQQVMAPLLKRPEFNKLVVLRLNFDSQEQYWKQMGVRQQSTLIAFKGRNEVARTVGETDENAITKVLRTAIR